MSNGPKIVRTTVRVPDDLHRRVKALAAERGIVVQDLIEMLFLAWVDGALDPSPGSKRRKTGSVPAHLEPVVQAFAEFWQHPRDDTDKQLRRFLEFVLAKYK
jgi:hypothetical protein